MSWGGGKVNDNAGNEFVEQFAGLSEYGTSVP
jgi:hypothetical protein